MILVDTRLGSGKVNGVERRVVDLPNLLRGAGLPVTETRLEYGDASFLGHGPRGRVTVGVELKLVQDMVNSIKDDRFAGHQLPGLRATYDETWLIVQGPYRPSSEGILEVPRGYSAWGPTRGVPMMYSAFNKFLMTMEIRGGLRLRRTWGPEETTQVMKDLYKWWQEPFAKHHAHLAFDDPQRMSDATLLTSPSLTRRWAKELDFIGWDKSAEVDRYFHSAQEMAVAGVVEWMNIPGVGRGIATKAVEMIAKRRK